MGQFVRQDRFLFSRSESFEKIFGQPDDEPEEAEGDRAFQRGQNEQENISAASGSRRQLWPSLTEAARAGWTSPAAKTGQQQPACRCGKEHQTDPREPEQPRQPCPGKWPTRWRR